MTALPWWVDVREVVLVDDVIVLSETIKATLEALNSCGLGKKIYASFNGRLEQQEIRIQPDFCGHKVPTIKNVRIDLRLREIDAKEGIFLFENHEWLR